MLRWLWAWLKGPETGDGMGVSWAEEIRLGRRAKALRRVPVEWRKPDDAERRFYDDHPLIARFADDTIAIADIEGRRWVVRQRMWFGWPDPPEFAVFAFEGEAIWAAEDFDRWPNRWSGVRV